MSAATQAPSGIYCLNDVQDSRGRWVKCRYWLGESLQPVVYVASVKKGEEVTIAEPRDVRICKGCGQVAVFVPRAGLDLRRAAS